MQHKGVEKMKREDFKMVTAEYIESCKIIIEDNGTCKRVNCSDCPFFYNNTILVNKCGELYTTGSMSIGEHDIKLLQSAKDFLEMYKSTGAIIGEGTVAEDKIKSPNHYKLEGLNCETIDVVKARLGKDGFKAFCVGNVLKYVLRAEKKNGLEDYKKSRQYLDWIIEGEEK